MSDSSSYDPYTPAGASTEVDQVIKILTCYHDLLESGLAGSIHGDPFYQWKYWKGGVDMGIMRLRLKDADTYLNLPSQHGWADGQQGDGVPFDAGPRLSSLPDGAVMAMFQEIDKVFYEGKDGDRKVVHQDLIVDN